MSIPEVLSGARPWWVATASALDVLRSLPEGCVHVCVTSPPYWMLRSYIDAKHPQKHLELGQERVPCCMTCLVGSPCGECFVCHLVEVFREVRRVLHRSGTLWLNLAGSYASGTQGNKNGGPTSGLKRDGRSEDARLLANTRQQAEGAGRRFIKSPPPGWRAKDYVNTPALLAEALRVDGWYFRAEVSLEKIAPMPESVRDRPTRASERLYLLAKQGRYFYDAESERVPASADPVTAARRHRTDNSAVGIKAIFGNGYGQSGNGDSVSVREKVVESGRNLWDWWDCPLTEEEIALADDLPVPAWEWRPEGVPARLKEGHYAVMPSFLARRCIRLGSSEHGVCGTCGAPWVRVVERTAVNHRSRPDRQVATGGAINGGVGKNFPDVSLATLGWAPSCSCPDPSPRPALVLDPFAGSGTTLVVARLLGRRALGVELSPAHAELARRRVGEAAPLLDAAAPAVEQARAERTLFDEEES